MRQKLFQCDEGDGVGTFVTDGDMEPFCSEPGGGFRGVSGEGELRRAVSPESTSISVKAHCSPIPQPSALAAASLAAQRPA